ncbi:MAG: leucine-rich repeat domain-containing protein, partial [Muribaculaceae bacterium]|nr:leucine-rich repeat domain-containing protein [Muribaculaceae bacterium]
SSAFTGCSSLREVTIPNSVTSIGSSAFNGCSGLTYLTIGNSVARMGNNAFSGCNNLGEVILRTRETIDYSDTGLLSNENSRILLQSPVCDWSEEWIDNISSQHYLTSMLDESDNEYYIITSSPSLKVKESGLNVGKYWMNPVNTNSVLTGAKNVSCFYKGSDITVEVHSANGYGFDPNNDMRENVFYVFSPENELEKTVTVTSAGTLFDKVGLQNIEKIEKLVISGDLNGTDILTINRMTALKYLDISRANIVEGGTTYRENLKTSDKVIGSYFFNDINLEYLFLPNSVSQIDANALNGSSTLKVLTIGSGTKEIGMNAFMGCSQLHALTIPGEVESIMRNSFSGCKSLRYLTLEAGEKLLKLSDNNEKGMFYDCPLDSVNWSRNYSAQTGQEPFANKITLRSVNIGHNVTSIPANTFSGCNNLNELVVPNSIQTIYSGAFVGCSSLSKLIIEESQTNLNIVDSKALFASCPIKWLELGRNITCSVWPFSYREKLEYVAIGDFVDAIPGKSFMNSTLLSTLIIGGSVKSIGSYAFENCGSLENIELPECLKTIGNYAFANCSLLSSIAIPDATTLIGSFAFSNCSSMTESMLGNSVNFIGNDAFSDCIQLKEVIIPNSVTSLGSSAFSGCTALESAILSNNLTEIQTSTFQNTGLKEIEIPYKVGSIAKDAFRGCQRLEKVILPASLTKAGSYAFGECPAITQVYSLNTTPPVIESSTFDSEVEEKASLHVKKGSMVHYWLDPVWKEFKNMNEDLLCLEAIPAATYGDGEIDLAQYAPEGVKLRYETSNSDVVEINGNMMRIVGAGEATVGAILDEEQGTPMELMGQMRQFVVDKADLEITVAEIVIEAGQPLPDFSYLSKGLQYDDTLDDIEELPEPVCDVDEYSPMGEYPVYFTEGNDRNYNIATKESKVIVGAPSGVENGSEEMMDNDSEVEVYTLNGMFVYRGPRKEAQLERGVYIVRQGKVTAKIIVK